MTQPAERRRYSAEEYLRFERDSTQKHEFHDGEILAMSGGSPTHSLISSNVIREVGVRLKGKRCHVYDSNLRVWIAGTRRYVYPDSTIICGPLQFDPNDPKLETVANPRVIVEVLSPSTNRMTGETSSTATARLTQWRSTFWYLRTRPASRCCAAKPTVRGRLLSLREWTRPQSFDRSRLSYRSQAYAAVEFPPQGEAPGAVEVKR